MTIVSYKFIMLGTFLRKFLFTNLYEHVCLIISEILKVYTLFSVTWVFWVESLEI